MAELESVKLPLRFNLAPNKLDFDEFNLLSDRESDSTPQNSLLSEINEIKAQLDIVNEDRERLKKETEKLYNERDFNLYRLISNYADTPKRKEFEKISVLQGEIDKFRKECEEKDRLLNTMRGLLGSNGLSSLFNETQDTKQLNSPTKPRVINRSNSKLPVMRHTDRSVSPFAKLF